MLPFLLFPAMQAQSIATIIETDRSPEAIAVVLDEVLAQRTYLTRSEFPAEMISLCEGSMRCLVGRRPAGARLILLLRVFDRELEATLVDAEVVELLTREARRDRAGWRALLEDELLQAVDGEEEISLRDHTLTDAIHQLFTYGFRDALVAVHAAPPHARLEVSLPDPAAVVTVDGRPAGVMRHGRIEVPVVPGDHQVRVEHPKFITFTQTVVVPENRVVHVDATTAIPKETYRMVRLTMGYASIGVATAGVSFLAFAASRKGSDVGCRPSTPTSFGRCGRQPPYAALGYTLLVSGVSIALTTLLVRDDSKAPWWQPLVGLITGAVTFTAASHRRIQRNDFLF